MTNHPEEGAQRVGRGPAERSHLVMAGLMGVGKTTTGQALAEALGWDYVDSDHDIQTLFGQTGQTIAAEAGVPVLHRLEAAVLLGALARSEPAVISAAGSVVEDPYVRRALASQATVVVLSLPPEATLDRQGTGDHRRPMGAVELQALAEARRPLFDEVADLQLSTDRPTDELVREVLEHLGRGG